MTKTIFTCSEHFKSEYSCAVVRINELTPIEGSDFLAKTLVMGTQIVVRKDQVKPGDIMLYSANETQLNERFLSVNNLFEVGCREKNANLEEVNAILKPYLDTKVVIDNLRSDAKNIRNIIDQLTKKNSKINKEIKKMEKDLDSIEKDSEEYKTKSIELDDKKQKVELCNTKIAEKTQSLAKLKKKIEEMVKSGEPIVSEAKKKCGFFNKYGRVRLITLRGEASFGFLFSISELQKFDSSITAEDVEAYEGKEFDTVNGELFVKAYVPPVKEVSETRKERTNKAQKKVKRFDRMIDGQFNFHYDTQQLQKYIHLFKPDDVVTISLKIHGTSLCSGKLKVREPKKIAFYKRAINGICEWVNGKKPFIDYDVVYGNVTSSRTVIKNKTINPTVKEGFYDVDIWTEWGEAIYPYLNEGMTIYAEIFGKLKGGKYIQKSYDYGCDGEINKLMPYRITTSMEDGSKFEWEVPQVKEWTEELIRKMREDGNPYADRIHPIDILYHGTLANLYPEIDTENHWHENVLDAMRNDKEHFGMEMDEPLCTFNKVPREGIVIRKFGDPIKESFKLKTNKFFFRESELMDDSYVDIESTEGDYQ